MDEPTDGYDIAIPNFGVLRWHYWADSSTALPAKRLFYHDHFPGVVVVQIEDAIEAHRSEIDTANRVPGGASDTA